jgi:hypothetical protein
LLLLHHLLQEDVMLNNYGLLADLLLHKMGMF